MLAGSNPSGAILPDGRYYTCRLSYINMMFQSVHLPHMTGAERCVWIKQDRLPKDIIAQRVEEMLKLVHMEKYASHQFWVVNDNV